MNRGFQKPEQIFSLEAGAYAKPKSVSEIVRAGVSAPTKPTGGHAKLQPSALKVAQRLEPKSKMDRLVDQLDYRAKAMIKNPTEYTRRRFYDTADAILRTGNGLPASATLINAGLTKKLILKGLVQRGYMPSYQGPSPLQVRARRAVNWFTAQPAVSRAFTRRGNPAAQKDDCRSVLCPDAGPEDQCVECDEMEQKNQHQMLANRAIVIKSNVGGTPARLDGMPARYNSLGQRIR